MLLERQERKMLNKVVICGIDTSSLEVIPGAEMKELL